MATGFPTKANWAAGDVLTASALDDLAGTVNLLSPAGVTSGYALTANGTSNSVTWAAMSTGSTYVSGKNFSINGGFDIWQRGTTFAPAGSVIYTADRWCTYRGGPAAALTQQSVSPNYSPYYLRYGRNLADTSTAALLLSQSIETKNALPLAGKTITFSFYARAGANYSATSNALVLFLNYGTGTDQNLLSSFTGSTSLSNPTATLTTSWQRFSYTVNVPTSSTEIGWYFQYTPTGVAGAADYYDLADVQLEVSSSATAYSRSHGDMQGELAACQRYYFRAAGGSYTGANLGFGNYGSAPTTAYVGTTIPAPVTMRTAPSSVDYSSNLAVSPDELNSSIAVTAVALSAFSNPNNLSVLVSVSGATQYRPYRLIGTTTSTYVGFSAEL